VIYGLNVCTPEEEKKCKAEIGDEEHALWACEQCEKRKAGNIHPWTEHLLRLRKLQKAGYPFKKEDLSYDEWRDLGTLNQIMEAMNQ
jgi:hypothetical protein